MGKLSTIETCALLERCVAELQEARHHMLTLLSYATRIGASTGKNDYFDALLLQHTRDAASAANTILSLLETEDAE